MTSITSITDIDIHRLGDPRDRFAAGASLSLTCLWLLVALLASPATATATEKDSQSNQEKKTASSLEVGQQIYLAQCADCHGDQGQGVSEQYDAPLSGDLNLKDLADLIAETMPEGEPEKCIGEDATSVANYIFERFYGQSAQVRNQPPRAVLTRLTGEQLRQSLADLYGHFQGAPQTESKRGVAASYFEGSRWAKDKLKLERTDPTINFDFGKGNPVDGVPKEEFYIHWSGSLKVDHSGRYEIILRSTLSCTLDFGANDRTLVDNHVQSAGKEEFRRTLSLVGGRTYPFSIEFIQRKRKTEQPPAAISLSWVPPSGVEEIIPSRNLLPNRLPDTFAIQTKLPADDRSYGYERGTAVNRLWDESTTKAALEFAEVAKDELFPRFRRSNQNIPEENRGKLRNFLEETIQTAIRGPLSEEMRTRYIDEQLAAAEDDGEAIKRSLLISLKSPRFLYPTIDTDRSVSQRRANRLALILYDSLPSDQWLVQRIEMNQLIDDRNVRQAATKMLSDYRAQAKIRSFLYRWLDLNDLDEISKDEQTYPGFDPELVHHLQSSLDAFIDENLKQGGDFRQLLLADWAITSPELEAFYGDAWAPKNRSEQSQPTPTDRSASEIKPTETDAIAPPPEQQPNQSAKKNNSDQVTPPQQQAPSKETPKEKQAAEEGEQRLAEGSGKAAEAEQESDITSKSNSSPDSWSLTRSVENRQVHVGLITHPLLMSHLAYYRTSSPIHRGVFLTRYTLGRVLRPPSEAFTPINPTLHPDLTTRQRVEMQTGEVNCQVCHRKINSLGFALEAFDAVGRFRSMEKGKKVDTSGGYVARSGKVSEFEGARELANYLVNSPDCHEAFVEAAFEHFVKQPIAAYDQQQLTKLTDYFRDQNFSIEKLIVEIACIASSVSSPVAEPNSQ